MLERRPKTSEIFPSVSLDQWREASMDGLAGTPFGGDREVQTAEELSRKPLYTAADECNTTAMPRLISPQSEISGGNAAETKWDIRQEYHVAARSDGNRAILEDLHGGATSLQLVFDRHLQAGQDSTATRAGSRSDERGVATCTADELDELLAGVDLSQVLVALDAGAAFLPAAGQLFAVWRRRNVSLGDARVGLNADPIGYFARTGSLPHSIDRSLSDVVDLAVWCNKHCPRVSSVGVDTSPYYDAGANDVQDLAFSIGTAVEYLRVLTEGDLPIDDAGRQITFQLSLGTQHFLSIAKLRALRKLWSRVIELCGGSTSACSARIHAKLSQRVTSRLDPHVNILRNSAAVFAAGIGGADAITSMPHDAASGATTTKSRRIALHAALIMQHEANLHRVCDPGGGSWMLENLTQQLAERAWDLFQQIEVQGGMIKALMSGWVAERIRPRAEELTQKLATRRTGMVGVNRYPAKENKLEVVPAHSESVSSSRAHVKTLEAVSATPRKIEAVITAAEKGASIGELASALGLDKSAESMVPIPSCRPAHEFELLRAACDNHATTHGFRPTVCLLRLETIDCRRSIESFARECFEVGGFEVVDTGCVADFPSDLDFKIAAICISQAVEEALLTAAISELKATEVRTVVVVANGVTATQVTDVDYWVDESTNLVAMLRVLLQEAGVTIA